MESIPRMRYITSMATMIDTLKVSRSLEEAGFGKAQADIVASTLAEAVGISREDLVTKDFLRGELAELRSELKTDIAQVRTELAAQKSELIRWMLASQAMLLAALVALANFTKLL